MSDRTVAVTGATGFLGRHVVRRLSIAGWRVRVLSRSDSGGAGFEGRSPAIVVGDLADEAALRQLVSGADAVIHSAGLIKARTRTEFLSVNEDGARRVGLAARGRRIIHVSSLAAREPGLSDYAWSKRAGEDVMRDVGGSAVTVIRPPAIYGPGDRETLTLFKAVQGPLLVAPGARRARVAIAEVDDVARDIVSLLGETPSASTITIGGDRPEGYHWSNLIAAASRAAGGRPFVVHVPPWVLKAAGAGSDFMGRWRREPSIFSLGKAREALHPDWSVSPLEQGVTASRTYTPLDQGFARVVAWYRTQGWLT